MIRRTFHIPPLFGLLFLAVLVVFLFYVVKYLLYLLYYGTPVLLLLVLILDYRVFRDHFMNIFRRMRRDPVGGILSFIIQILALPFVLVYMLVRILFMRKLRGAEERIRRQREGEWADYEIIEDELKEGRR